MSKRVRRIELTDGVEKKYLGKIARESAIAAQNRCLASGVSVVTMDGDDIVETSADGKVTVITTLQRVKPCTDLLKTSTYGNIVVVKPTTRKRQRVSRKKLES